MRFLLALIAVTTIDVAAPAQVLFNSNGFESPTFTLGTLSGQNGWIVDGSANFQVQNTLTASGAQAVRVQGGTRAWTYPNVSTTPTAGQLVRIQTDIARSTPTGPVETFIYGIDVYNAAVDSTTLYGLVNNGGVIQPFVRAGFNTTTQQFDPSQEAIVVPIGGAVPADTFVNFDAYLNYTTKSLRLLVNGVDVGADIPFIDLTATDIADADLHVDTDPDVGASDFGYFDNYVVSVVPVPEPATTGLVVSAAFAGVVAIGRMRRRAAVAL